MRLYYPTKEYEGKWESTSHMVPKDSILFFPRKEYPVCNCGKRYLPELGCYWCVYLKREKVIEKPVAKVVPKKEPVKTPYFLEKPRGTDWYIKQLGIVNKQNVV